ncbi:MAG: tRNA methyltransferase, partial [Deltaproteobacteria bacterium]
MEVKEDLKRLIFSLLGEGDGKQFLRAIGERDKTAFRINPLKVSQKDALSLLGEEGFKVEPFASIPNAFIAIEEPFPLGKSLSHFIGNIYIQDLSSMLPPLLLDPEGNELVLDIAAAPGSKTTQMAALMKNKGCIVANEPSARRVSFLCYNLGRMGVVNTIVVKEWGNRLGRIYLESFDRVLIDPPCSALGTIRSSPEVTRWWTLRRSEKLVHIQRDLLISGIKALKKGGTLVYSTCTIVPQENEGVIAEVLKRYPVEVEPLCLNGFKTRAGLRSFEGRQFPSELERCLRIYPHENPGEGFFLAKLRKL